MADTKASEAGRELVRYRWGDRVVRRSAVTLLERAELSDAARAELEQIAGQPAGEGDDAA